MPAIIIATRAGSVLRPRRCGRLRAAADARPLKPATALVHWHMQAQILRCSVHAPI
ncbi:hypothetical protein LC55x_0669 [Lysobacter capsici]|nr:hypothetical protein LC55x_0669 [Lysobacter capsici]